MNHTDVTGRVYTYTTTGTASNSGPTYFSYPTPAPGHRWCPNCNSVVMIGKQCQYCGNLDTGAQMGGPGMQQLGNSVGGLYGNGSAGWQTGLTNVPQQNWYTGIGGSIPNAILPPYQSIQETYNDLPEETVVAALTGYRSWLASPFDSIIKSMNGTVWEPYKWLESKCSLNSCQGAACSCGIYSFREKRLFDKSEYGGRNRVCGEVWLKGTILQCTEGYRASHAYPKNFQNTGILAQRMAKIYGVPLVELPSVEIRSRGTYEKPAISDKVMQAIGLGQKLLDGQSKRK